MSPTNLSTLDPEEALRMEPDSLTVKLHVNEVELRIGVPIQNKPTDHFRHMGALAVKGKPERVAFKDLLTLPSGRFSDAR